MAEGPDGAKETVFGRYYGLFGQIGWIFGVKLTNVYIVLCWQTDTVLMVYPDGNLRFLGDACLRNLVF